MITIILITCITLLTSIFLYRIDSYNIIYTVCDKKYKKWNKVTALVSSNHTSKVSVYLISIKMILQAIYLSFIQYLNNSVRKLDKNTYEVEYIIGGKIYKMIVIPKKGPNNILYILDENNNDLTDFILPYYGPNYDWHFIKLSPQFFRYKKIIFYLADGTEKVFRELEYINL